MKKILAMTLALTMTAVMFASCGNSDEGDENSSTAPATTTPAPEEDEPEESKVEEKEEPEEKQDEEPTAAEDEAPAEFDVTKINGYDENATETVFELTDEVSSAWASIFGDDIIDARTFERDKDMHFVVDFEYVESFNEMLENELTDQHKTQIVIGTNRVGDPVQGWVKIGDSILAPGTLVTEYPSVAEIEDGGEWVLANGEDMASADTADLSKSEQVWPDVFVKNDGFIKIGNHDVKQIEFTITADIINEMIDNAFENGWDGMNIQVGGNVYVTKITIDQGNVFMLSTITDSGM